MQEIRVALKKKAEKGQPTLSKEEANRTWREDILGIHSEEQKQKIKEHKQKQIKKFKKNFNDEDSIGYEQ